MSTAPTNWFATAVHILDESTGPAFLAARSKGARPVEPRYVSPSNFTDKAEDIRLIMADPFAAFVKPVVLVQKEQSASRCSAPSYDASRRSSALRQDEVGAA